MEKIVGYSPMLLVLIVSFSLASAVAQQASWTWTDKNCKQRTLTELRKLLEDHQRSILLDPIGHVKKLDLSGASLENAPLDNALLANVDLSGADLSDAHLSGANLINANLTGAVLVGANLQKAQMDNARMSGANLGSIRPPRLSGCSADVKGPLNLLSIAALAMKPRKINPTNLTGADLSDADLSKADLSFAILTGTNLDSTNLQSANLKQAFLQNAKLRSANLRYATVDSANLSDAILASTDLEHASLNSAILSRATVERANLKNASLYEAKLNGAFINLAQMEGADLRGSDVQGLGFEPKTLPDIASLASAENLEFMTYRHFPSGLYILRKQFEDGGFREQERELTYALMKGEELHDKDGCRLQTLFRDCGNYVFYTVFFDWTSRYGEHPGRPLILLVELWILAALVYFASFQFPGRQGVWIIVESRNGSDKRTHKKRIEMTPIRDGSISRRTRTLIRREWQLAKAALFFSVTSAFNIGYQELNIGQWLRMVSSREFEFRPEGWLRSLAGLQSLLSMYLLALWLLTYFGHPFS
jgi:uncharacterized protein YjbI with pentapeptide repeats